MNWEEELAARAGVINAALEAYLPPAGAYPPRIHEAMRYSLFAGGKRLRGAMLLATAGMLGLEEAKALPAACAFEMVHTYSLVHDDLPAMDNDDFRRGKPTCHRVFGEAIAILAGDALLTLAFATLCRLEADFGPERTLKVVAELAEAAGTRGLIGGQVVDLESEGKEVDAGVVEYIHHHKTGALFRAAVRSGALLAGCTKEELEALTRFATCFGLAFQIGDDILDLTGDPSVLGKPVQRDLERQKATYPRLFGLEGARHLLEEQVERALGALEPFGERAEFLRGAARFLLARRV